MIVTSGGMTYNQQEFRHSYLTGADPAAASPANRGFDNWLSEQVAGPAGPARSAALRGFMTHPDAALAHPQS